MNFKKLIFIAHILSFLIGQAISTPKTIKPFVELEAVDEFSLVTFIGAEGEMNSSGVVDYKIVKLYSITKNNNLVDYKKIFEFPISENSLSSFSGAHLGDITGDETDELILFISNPNTGTQIMSFTVNPGFSFTKLHDPHLIKSNQKQSTLLSSGLATIYEDKDKEIIVSFGAPERKVVIINYDGELNSKIIAKKFLANSVGVIKILTPDLNNDNISDIYLLSNNPNMKEEKTYYSPGHKDTDDSKIINLKENIQDVCFAPINEEESLSKIFLLDNSKIYIESLNRYFELPLEKATSLTTINKNTLLSINKKGRLIIFDIVNNQINVKQNITPGFNNKKFTKVEYLVLKNNQIILSHNGESEILFQSLSSQFPENIIIKGDEKEMKDVALEALLLEKRKTEQASKDNFEVSSNVLDQQRTFDIKDNIIFSKDSTKTIKNNLKIKNGNQGFTINGDSLNTTLMRDTLIVNVGERAIININLNKEYNFIGLEKEKGPESMSLNREKLVFEWTPSGEEIGYNELEYKITYNVSKEFEEYFEEGIQKLKQKEDLKIALNATSIFVNAKPIINISPLTYYEIQAEEELIVPIHISDPNPQHSNILTLNMEPALSKARIEDRKFYWRPEKKDFGTNKINFIVNDGILSSAINIQVIVDTVKVELGPPVEDYATVNKEFLHKIPMLSKSTATIISAPENVRISSDGYIHWIPTKPQLELNKIVVEIKEQKQSYLYSLNVFVNAPPIISYRPNDINYLTYGEDFQFTLKSFDENENQLLFWKLLDGPDNMILENAQLHWSALNSDFNSYSIELTDELDTDIFYGEIYVNDIPIFTSIPVEYVTLGQIYEYNIEVVDKNKYNMNKESNSIDLFLKYSPKGMTIVDKKIIWEPGEAQIGSHFIEIESFDGIALTSQSFTVFVNDIPQIISSDSLKIEIGNTLHHFIKAQDSNIISKLTYGIQSDLNDLTISPKTGEIIWTPSEENIGYHTINASVSDEFLDLGKDMQPIVIFVYKNPQFENTLLPEAYAGVSYSQIISARDMHNRSIPEKDIFINFEESTLQEINFDELTYELSIMANFDEVGLQYITMSVLDQYNNKTIENFPISVLTSPCEIIDTTYYQEDEENAIERSSSTIKTSYYKKQPTILEKTEYSNKKEPVQYMTIEETNITEIIDTVFLTTLEVEKYFPELSEVIKSQEISSELSNKELRKLKRLQKNKEKSTKKAQKKLKEEARKKLKEEETSDISFVNKKKETIFSDKLSLIKTPKNIPEKVDLYKVKNEIKRKTVLAIMDDFKKDILKSIDELTIKNTMPPIARDLGHNIKGIKTPPNDNWKTKEYKNVFDFSSPDFNYDMNSWNGVTGERKALSFQ